MDGLRNEHTMKQYQWIRTQIKLVNAQIKTWAFILFLLMLCGCAVPATRFVHIAPDGTTTTVEMPKEMESEELYVRIDPRGFSEVKAKRLTTKSADAINAQAKREAQNLNAISEAVGRAAGIAAKTALTP